MSRVTVAIAAHNAAPFIRETLESVRAQTFRDLEIVVADDGSTDATAEIAEAVGDVRVLQRKQGGPAAARNDAIRASVGEYVAVLDADDLWLPTKLERQVALLDERADLILAGTLAENFGGPPAPPEPLREGEVTEALIGVDFLTTSSVLFRRSAFEEAGGFDEDPALISVEDYDLWLRMSLLGGFGGIDEVLVRRRVHESNLSADHLELSRRALGVIGKFERVHGTARCAGALARRKGELGYLVGRALLSRGRRLEGRHALRRARSWDPGRTLPCLALEALSLLPRRALLGLHAVRERQRSRAR